MKCIVVPVNFTPRSLNAARYAADLAVALGADLRLLSTLSLPSSRPLAPTVIDEIRHSGLEALNSLAAELQHRVGGKIHIHTDQQSGEAGERLLACCKELRPFLVVVTAPVDRHLPCPALIVPDKTAFHPIHTIAVACDRDDILSGMSDHMSFITELNNRLNCRFDLIHIIRNGEGSISRLTQEYGEWKSRPPFLPAKLHFIRQDQPQLGMNEYLHDHDADWVMVLPKPHGWIEFHESQAHNILEVSEVPVISVYE